MKQKTRNLVKEFFSFRTVLVLFFAACLCCTIPASRDGIMALMEHIIARPLKNLQKWNAVITYSMRFFALVAAAAYFFIYTKKGREFSGEAWSRLRQPFAGQEGRKQAVLLFAVYVVCYFALLRADYNYKDDVQRLLGGHKSWVEASRYISESAAVFLHTNFYLNDISPLSQLIAMGILTLSSCMLAWNTAGGRPGTAALLASAFIGITPFYFENMSYKFDSPYMAFSMLAGVLPFMFTATLPLFTTVSVLSLLAACCSYQAANSVYVVLAIGTALIMFLDGKKWKDIGTFVLCAVVSYVAALLFFRLVLMIPTEVTIDERNAELLPGIQLLTRIRGNFLQYTRDAARQYGNLWLKGFTAVLALLFPVAAAQSSRRGKLISALTAAAALLLMFALSFGAYLFIGNPVTESRALMGLDALIAFAGVFTASRLSGAGKLKYVSAALTGCLLYGFCVCTTVAGNLYAKQKEYENFRYTLLMHDLSLFVRDLGTTTVYITGGIGQTAAGHMDYQNYRMYIGDVTMGWVKYKVLEKNMNLTFLSPNAYADRLAQQPELQAKLESLPLLMSTYYHSIYGEDRLFYVTLKTPQVDGYENR